MMIMTVMTVMMMGRMMRKMRKMMMMRMMTVMTVMTGRMEAFNKVESIIFRCAVSTSFYCLCFSLPAPALSRLLCALV